MRDDARLEKQMYSNIGQGINAGIQQYRKSKLEAGIVSTLQRGIAEGRTPEQMREDLLGLKGIVDTGIGQEMIEAQTNIGRYRQDTLDTQLKQSRIDATKALTDQRARRAKGVGFEGMTIQELQNFRIKEEKARMEYDAITNQPENKLKKDPARLAEYDRQIQLVNKRISELTGGGKPTVEPVPTPFKADIDAVTMAAPVTGQPPQDSIPQNKNDAAIGRELAGTRPEGETDAAAAAMEGPPGSVNPTWFKGAGQQPGEFVKDIPAQAEPQSQEQFEQTVSQMVKTDRAAAKAYYDTWVKKWQ